MRRPRLLFLLLTCAAIFAVPTAAAQAADPDGGTSTFQTRACGPDADCDGTPDAQDACPNEAGYLNGCPDSDGDRVPDNTDACPTVRGEPAAGGCPDADRDGVRDSADRCQNTNATKEAPIDAEGCGVFRASANLGARSTLEMQDDPDIHGQCENPKGARCTFRMTVTLAAASAKRLGIPRRIADVDLVCDKSTYGGKYTYDNGSTNLKRAVVRAFRKAYEDNIPVTMTFTGSYVLGSAARVALPKSTFTMKRKPPGGTAYHIEPSVSNGPGGPQATGLTRTPLAGDSRFTPQAAAASPKVDFRVYGVTSVKTFALDKANFTQANCDNAGEPCSVHATVTLDAKTAKAAHITNRRIATLEIPLTTKAEQDAAHSHQSADLSRPIAGTLRLGLSSSVRKKLSSLTSVTITVRANYTLGSAGPLTLGSKTITFTRKNNLSAYVILRSYQVPATNEGGETNR